MAIKTNPTFPARKEEVKIKYFAKKPAVGGIPASESKAIVITTAKNGLDLPKPLNESIPSVSFESLIIPMIQNVAMEATEYAAAYVKIALLENALPANKPNNI